MSGTVALPRLERVLDLSMMALLLGLFSTDLLANDMSAVTLVMDILKQHKHTSYRANRQEDDDDDDALYSVSAHLPSNLCFRKSNRAFCIMSVTCRQESGQKKQRRRISGEITHLHVGLLLF